MFTKPIKNILAAGVLAVGSAVAFAAPAQAGSNFGVYIGNGYGSGIYYGNSQPRYRGHRHRAIRHGRCAPRRAVNKAYRYGLNRPYIKRINGNRVVVGGFNRGHRASIVFKRNSHRCAILKTRGI